MSTEIRCPNPQCRQLVQVSEEQVGQELRCDKCGKAFLLTDAGEETDRFSLPSRESAEMLAPTQVQGPTKIGRFVIRAKLGAGAFGVVYRAFDPAAYRGGIYESLPACLSGSP